MIVVFGSINVDLTAVVERFPRPGETIGASAFAVVPGGKGANQALAARRAGARVAMAGALGKDALAATTLDGLVAAGVDVAWVRRVDAPTGVAMILVDAEGQNAIAVVPGANGEVLASALPEAALAAETTLVLQLEIPMAAVIDVALRARRLGARVMLNAAPAGTLSPELLSGIDVLIVNEHEAATLAASIGVDASPEPFAEQIFRRHRCAVIVTLGARGALAIAAGKRLAASAPPVDVVDTTGAGDAFVGALAAALDRGSSWPRALAEGVSAGSLACGRRGAQSALPGAEAIANLADAVESSIVTHSIP